MIGNLSPGSDFERQHDHVTVMRKSPFVFDNSYARLPDRFYSRLSPTRVGAPQAVVVNEALAQSLDIDPDALKSDWATEVFAGNQIPDGAEPLAMVYAGHQFGHFVPQLGDGRAILLGEVIDRNNERQDIHLKGAGRTPYSRGGDGRAALGPVLREYIVSSHMHSLGIPTTRALAVVTTGEPVYREGALPGAILTRVAKSHLRVGTFQYFAARQDTEALKVLTDFSIARHYPEHAEGLKPAAALLEGVLQRQSRLVAKWIATGFIHGVMNTDNTSISGETIDYGPCAFIDTYRPDKVFSSIDHAGRYAFMNQPHILQWNLAQLAQCLLPLLDERADKAISIAQDVIDRFPDIFAAEVSREFARKLGLADDAPDALDLAFALLELMAENKADFTLTFRHLAAELDDADASDAFLGQFDEPVEIDAWLGQWRARVTEDNETKAAANRRLLAANPAVIARNHLVEEVIRAAEDRGDFAPLHDLLAVLTSPFTDTPANSKYAKPPKPEEEVTRTFCGT